MASDDDNQDERRIALERIAREANERTGTLDLGWLGLTELPEELFGLTHLLSLYLGGMSNALDRGLDHYHFSPLELRGLITNLSRLAELPKLTELSLGGMDITDLSPLAGLSELRVLSFPGTRVTTLSPLTELIKLRELDCASNDIDDLSPLAELACLQSLDCEYTNITDLSPLSGLTRLESINCSNTKIASLAPLAGLCKLRLLDCSYTDIADLSPLRRLHSLKTLFCAWTQVTDLAPLVELTNLEELSLAYAPITDLSPLAACKRLRRLGCLSKSASDITPLEKLNELEEVWLEALGTIPPGFWLKSSLKEVILYERPVPGIPDEILPDKDSNCLPAILAHLRDLEAGAACLPDVKLMVLGNGRVGKTQICRRLRGEDYDEAVDSTHGIVLGGANLPLPDGAEPARLNLWDFGGQDLYHC